MGGMTKLLERATEKIRELSAKDQDALASALLSITGEETALVQLDDETRIQRRSGIRSKWYRSVARWAGDVLNTEDHNASA